ncbi:MAG: LPXTG cell wall anchor domain-containing protein [Minisyncoccia bacterium]
MIEEQLGIIVGVLIAVGIIGLIIYFKKRKTNQ